MPRLLLRVHRSAACFRMQAIGVLARCRAGVGPVPAPKPYQDGSILADWIAEFTIIRKQATLVYASSAKRMASTRPGPFLGSVLFFGRGLMMLIAEASSLLHSISPGSGALCKTT
jgi:hypothetical protein